MAETQAPDSPFGGLAVSAYLAAALDCVVVADASGCVVEFNPAAERTFGYSRDEVLGRTLADLIVPPSLREQHTEAFARFVATGEGRLLGQRLELTALRADGSEFPVELALSVVSGEPPLVCGALRDLTEAKSAHEDLRRHAAEYAALRRVATLVAQGALPAAVFAAVAEAVADLLGVPGISMVRFDAGDRATKVAGWGASPFPVGTSWALNESSVMALVANTGRPARIDDYATVPGLHAGRIRAGGIRSAVGVPITVEGRTWGVVIVFSTDRRQLALDAEERLARFTELVATAIGNSQARDDLHQLANEQAALRSVATLIAREVRPADVFAAVAREVALTLDVPLSSVVRFEADGTATQVGAWGEENPFPVGTSWPLDEHSVSGQVARTHEAARVDDYSSVPGTIAARLAREAGIKTAVGVPVLVDGRPWGVMMVLSSAERPLRDGIEARLGAFTELIATAIGNAQARDDLRRLADEQAALRRVALLVAQEADPPEVLAAVAREVSRVLDDAMIEIVRCDADRRATGVGAWGDHPFVVGSHWTLDGPSVIAAVADTGRPARIDDYADLPGSVAAFARKAGCRSAVGAPIVVDGRTWGVTAVISREPQPLPPETEGRLARFSELVATAISKTEARERLRRAQDEQAALRRVATLVAERATPNDVFAAVAEEVARLLDVPAISMVRFERDETSTAIAVWGEGNPFGVGATFEPWPGVMLQVRQTGRPARLEDYAYSTGPTTARLQAARIHSGVGVPITVEGRIWGTIIALATGGESLPLGIAERLSNFTDLVATAIANAEARDALDAFLREQAALRQVATLVAEGAGSPAVYDAICQETGQVIGATSVNLCHFTADRSNLTMSGWSLHDTHVPTGTRLPIEGGTINELVYESGAPARIESYANAEGALADLIRARGIKSEVAAPVIVDGRLWGTIIAGWDREGPPPAGAERRLAGFAELVGTAVSNALARSELVGSRARIVTAADEARRQIERNLHDGVQQQLVSLQLELKTVDAGVPDELRQTHDDIEHVQDLLDAVLDDVREIAQGVHPATLSQWGLEPAVRTLARRSPIPVELDLQVPVRMAQSIEIAMYYVLSEALANVAKHARATYAAVSVSLEDDWLRAAVRDDGVGGADAMRGSGIAGLVDRVEALGGRLSLTSAPQQGTTIGVALPLEPRSVDYF